ncbi:hypothetical protein ALC62_15979 [Cyphomyrmex costatus]|uniref:CCHC-type domain-containing protein n=2 Tax=Cyphomyrmex costatus TaxID=456900 RepID=A0A151I6H7_9HYME|nr:hypothetical protein ALC62_15979 [Cyphomyrmex costatus]
MTDDPVETIEYREQFESEYYEAIKATNSLLGRYSPARVVPLAEASFTQPYDQHRDVIENSFEQLQVQQNAQTEQHNNLLASTSAGVTFTSQSNVPSVKLTDVKLPIIELPKFKGDLSNWLKFRDTYKSLIHDNQSISNIQKFHYLIAALEGSAAQIVDEYKYNEQNYEIVWDALHRRYDDPKLLIYNHIEAMFKTKGINGESAVQLNSIIDSFTKHTRALKKLQEPAEHWDSLLIYLIVTKLDNETAREWEKQKLLLPDKPKLENLIKSLRDRVALLQTMERKNGVIKTKGNSQSKTNAFLSNKTSCILCKGEHYIQKCSTFLKLTPQERTEKVKQLKLCTNCLKKGHFIKDCSFGACRKCDNKHNTLLHFERGAQSPPSSTTTMCSSGQASAINESNVILATALVNVSGASDVVCSARAFLDSCAQSNFISESLCNNLKLEKSPVNTQVMSLNQPGPKIRYKCELEIKARNGGFKFKATCLIIPKIVDEVMPSEQVDLKDVRIPSHLRLADPSFNLPGQIDLLIGAQWFWDILCVGQVKLNNNLVMQKTRLGWIIGGPISATTPKVVQCNSIRQTSLEQQLTKFWEIEETLGTKALSQEKKDCESHFVKTTRRDEDGRFIVNMPLKEAPTCLGESRPLAVKRLTALEKRFRVRPELREDYCAFLKEYEQLGHMSEVKGSSTEFSYYLPHHCVVKMESSTTKTRVVFDASAPTTNGRSLNSIQMIGPVIQNDLFSILMRFRKHEYIISANIAKMYRQVLITEEQRPLQRIVWREHPNDPIKAYELNTVTYGTASASFQAIRCLHQLGVECMQENPEIARIIWSDFYVDDLLTGSDTIEGAINIAKQTSQILARGCFELRKWASNCPTVLSEISGDSAVINNIQIPDDRQRKTLGVS